MRHILLCLIFLFMGVTAPSTQAAEAPKFSLSATSDVAGSQFVVSQIDPCPGTEFNHETYAWVTFFDAAGAKIENYTLIEADGSWAFPVTIEIPHRTINRYDTSQQYAGPALGDGRVEVRCTVPSDVSATSQVYQSQPFTITAQAPEFALSTPSVPLEGTVQVSSQQSCPSGMPDVHVLIANAQVNIGFDTKADQVTRQWVVDAHIPKIVSVPMMGDQPFPLGKSVVSAWCYGQGTQYYGDQILEVKNKPIRMVALGDSYSAGVGTFKYYDTGNNCHRSELGYPPYIAKKFGYDDFTFAACSGAVTDDFYVANPQNANEPAQLSQLTEDTELVTLTIGGNDAGFEYVLNKCVQGFRKPPAPVPFGWGCSKNADLKRYVNDRLSALGGKKDLVVGGREVRSLLELYRDIHRAAPKAKIYVGGYPRLFGEDRKNYSPTKRAPSGNLCMVADQIFSVDFDDAQWINRQGEYLNEVIQKQVKAAAREQIPVTFVSPLIGGHSLCDKYEPWLNELILGEDNNPLLESFHPRSIAYQLTYGIEFGAAIRKN